MLSNPFPGLRHFEPPETHLFFGRDGQSNQLLRRLQHSRFLALVGVSGSGKSSLVHAGLLPALHGGLMAAVESDWRIAVFRPGNNPIGNMARALNVQAGLSASTGLTDVEAAIAETTLRRGNRGLIELVRQAKRKQRPNGEPVLAENENVLLVVDQFEEIFRIIEQHDELVRVKQLSGAKDADTEAAAELNARHPREEAAAFVKLLLESTSKDAHDQYEENIYVIITMRSDYLGESAQFWGMPERINEGQYLIPRMTRDERRQAIVGPIAVAGGEIGEPLVNQLLNDVGENPAQLPILQHALMRMWDFAYGSSAKNGGLQLKHYEKIGRMTGALSQHANEAYDELPAELQPLAAKIFKCLTEKGLSNREVRRPMTLGEICSVVGDSTAPAQEEDVKTVIDVFRKEGRSFLLPSSPKELETDTLIDISHESLIGGWDKLTKWVDEEAESARIYKRLADAAVLKSKREDLYRGTALALALKWKDDTKPNEVWARRYHPEFYKAMDFLKESEKRQRTERTRSLASKILTVSLVTFALGGLSYGWNARQNYLLNQQREAVKDQERLRLIAQERERLEQNLRVQAQATNSALASSLHERDEALVRARDAEKAAVAAATRAQNLQSDKQKEATNFAYFKTAFDDVAEANHASAINNLERALGYFVTKNDKQNQITTLINIGDVYRTSRDMDRSPAVDKYNTAIDLIGSDTKTLGLIAALKKKAGTVWEDSKDEQKRRAAAQFHRESADLYRKLEKNDEARDEYLASGRTLLGSTDQESLTQAPEMFDQAVAIYAGDNHILRIAETNAKIGKTVTDLLSKQHGEIADQGDFFSSYVRARLKLDVRSNREEGKQRDTIVNVGTRFFQNAAAAYAQLNDWQKAGDMNREAGRLFSKYSRELGATAASPFYSASALYAKAGNRAQQIDVLMEAATAFLRTEDAAARQTANSFFHMVLNVAKDEKERARLLTRVAYTYRLDPGPESDQKAIEFYEMAAGIYASVHDKEAEVSTLLSAARILQSLHTEKSKTDAAALYERAIKVYDGNKSQQAATLSQIALYLSVSSFVDQKKLAIDYYRRAAVIAKEAGDKPAAATALLGIGGILAESKEEPERVEATKVFEEAVNVYEGDIPHQVSVLGRIGSSYATDQKPDKDRALSYYRRAVSLARERGDKATTVNALLAQARGVAVMEGDAAESQIDQLYEQAVSVYNNDPGNQIQTLISIGRVTGGSYYFTRPGDSERSQKYLDKALQIAQAQHDKKLLASTHEDIGEAYQHQQRRTQAMESYERARKIYEELNDKYGQATVLYNMSLVDETKAQEFIDRALPLFNEALPILEAASNKKDLAEAYYTTGILYKSKKNVSEAILRYKKALDLYQQLGDADSADDAKRSIQELTEP